MALNKILGKNKQVIFYGFSLAALLFLLKWLELKFLIIDHAMEIYIGSIAVIFTSLGIWLALKLTNPKVKTVVVEKEVFIDKLVEKEVFLPAPIQDFSINQNALQQSGLSKRELEVLQLIATGMSNQEIAEKLFVSLPTIKTHASTIFEKLDAKRRTQAIEKAKKMGLVA